MTCCEHHNTALCDQGRKCPSRIPGVHTQDGGHRVNSGISFPMEAADPPIATPEGCQSVAAWVGFAAILAVCIAAALYQVTA
jgi:hypothetical protein